MKFKYNETARRAVEIARCSDGRLPSERELCEICGVSRMTAKKALDSLRNKGIVTRHVGRGTFLADGAKFPKVTFMIVKASTPPEIRRHLEHEAEIFLGKERKSRIEFMDIDENVVSNIQGAGTKIVLWPYIGRLSNLGAFASLDELPGFYDACSKIEASFCDWHRGLDGRMKCTAVPFNFSANVFCFNRRFAEQLGLDADSGPKSWDEVVAWAVKCSKDGKKHPTEFSDGLRHVLPMSYYLASSNGADYLEETSSGLKLKFNAGGEWLGFFRKLHDVPRNFKVIAPGPHPITRRKTLFSCEIGTWMICHYGNGIWDDLALSPVPPVRKGGQSCSQIFKNCLGIVPGTEPEGADLAWAFIKHLICDAGSQSRLVDAFPVLSVNKDVFGRQEEKKEWKIFVDAFRSGRSFSSHPVRFGLNALMRECFDDCMAGRLEPAEAADKIQDVGELLLKIERERTWF